MSSSPISRPTVLFRCVGKQKLRCDFLNFTQNVPWRGHLVPPHAARYSSSQHSLYQSLVFDTVAPPGIFFHKLAWNSKKSRVR